MPERLGAYGLALTGVEAASSLLVPAKPDWPSLELSWRVGGGMASTQWVRPDGALLQLQTGGQVEVDWAGGKAVFSTPVRLDDAELVHPYLAPVAGLAARWLGREGFHAGGVVVGSGAWGVLGDKEAGKTSLLASLAFAGHPIVTDDVLVVDEDGRALLGPRSLDLRADSARWFGISAEPAGAGIRADRRRIVPPTPTEGPPLRGFVLLAWGPETTVADVPLARRLAELRASRVVSGLPPREPRRLLELAALPMVEFRRPRDWQRAADASERLLGAMYAST